MAAGWTRIDLPGDPTSPDLSKYFDGEFTYHGFTQNWSDFGYAVGDIGDAATGDAIDASIKGRTRSHWHWNSTAPVPPKVFFKITVGAGAVAIGYADSSPTLDATIMGKSYSETTFSQDPAVKRNDRSLTKYVVVDTNGATDIWGPWVSFSSNAPISGGREYSGTPEDGTVYVLGNGESTPVDRGVAISSTIDHSYRKSTSQPTPEAGQPPLAPIAGSDPPVWKVPVEPGETRESVATISDAISPASPSPVDSPAPDPVPYWIGSTTYTANVAGITQPDFKWTFNQPTYGAQDADSFKSASASPIFLLAPAANVTGFPISSTVTVDVIDMDPGSPSDTLTDDYTVNWHLPIENTEEFGTPMIQYGLLPAVPRNGQLGVLAPGDSTQVMLNPSTAAAKVYLSSGEQLTVAIGKALLTRGATVYAGIAKPIAGRAAAFALLGWFYKVEMGEAMNQPEYASITNTEDEWQKAVSSTLDAINKVEGADYRIEPADIALESPSSTRWLGSEMTPWIKESAKVTHTRSDEYNGNGFVGRAAGEVYSVEKVEVVGHYQYDGRPPTMR